VCRGLCRPARAPRSRWRDPRRKSLQRWTDHKRSPRSSSA
jgi:hypothetical protein